MKKIILIAAIAITSINSYAQVSFGVQLGANLGMGHYKDNYYYGYATPAVANDPKVGFMLGALAEVDFGKLAFRPELNFIQKGSKSGYDAYYGYTSSASKITLNYVEIPLNVVYNLNVGSVGKAFFGVGPAIGIGISGKEKNGADKYDVKFDGKKSAELPANDNDTHLKRMDIGANILAGFQLSMGVFAKVGYTHGFSNIDPNKDDPNYLTEYHNRGVSFCVGYMLGSKGGKKK